jgi:hypothetical protein
MMAGGTEDKEHAMSQKLDTSPAVIGIDIGKNSFHIVGQNQRGAVVVVRYHGRFRLRGARQHRSLVDQHFRSSRKNIHAASSGDVFRSHPVRLAIRIASRQFTFEKPNQVTRFTGIRAAMAICTP